MIDGGEHRTQTVPPTERRLQAGESLFVLGERLKSAFLVLSGEVELLHGSLDGPRFQTAGPGEVVGEHALLEPGPALYSAKSPKGAVLRTLDRNDFLALVAENPSLALSIMKPPVCGDDAFTTVGSAKSDSPVSYSRARRLEIINEYKPDVVEIEDRPAPREVRWMLYILLGLFVSALVWACLAELDRVVVGQGRLITRSEPIRMQAFKTSLVVSMSVVKGQTVAPGEVLAELDPTFADSDRDRSIVEGTARGARLKRLLAEFQQNASQSFSDDAFVDEVEREAFARRRDEFQAKLRSFDSQLHEAKALLEGNLAQLPELKRQMDIASDIERRYKGLSEQGVASEAEYLKQKFQLSVSVREYVRVLNTVDEVRRRMDSLREEREKYIQEIKGRLAQELAEAQLEDARTKADRKKSERVSELVVLRASRPSVVTEVGPFAPGAVAREGDALVSLTPLDDSLEFAAEIEPRDIGYIRLADPARIKVDAYPYQRHGHINATLRGLSGNVVERRQADATRYLYTASLAVPHKPVLKDAPSDATLIPGMTGTAEIIVGKRRAVTYILYPLIRMLDSGLREP